MDRLPPQSRIDARGQVGEKLSEYFDFAQWPEKRDRKVTRQELLAILTRRWLIERDGVWYRRLWRWLRAPRGTAAKPVGGGQ